MRYSPLVIHGIPMPGGIPTKKLDCGFIQSIGNWFKESYASQKLYISDLYDNIGPNNWLGKQQGDLLSTVLGRSR